MVGDITDHAALEQGTPALKHAPFDLRECIASCVNLYRPIAENKGISLTLGMDASLPLCAVGDSFRLRQALGNIVSNAVKFTDAGAVRVYAEALECSGEHLRLAVTVSDTGPGLSQEDQTRVFESFQRGGDAAHTPGTGLGLNIAQTLAKLMGGDVKLASTPGQGACFTLSALLRQCAENERPNCMAETDARASYHSARQLLAQKKVLVAEDTASIAYALEQMLREMDAEPLVAASGEKALELLRNPNDGPWDMLVLDSSLPGIDGLEVLRAVRNGDTLTPFATLAVVYTATTSEAFLRKCEELGADAVFMKPLRFDQLRNELEKLVTVRARAVKHPAAVRGKNAIPVIIAREQPQQSGGKSENAVWNRNAALEALDGDENVLKNLAEVLETELNERRKALEIAVDEGDIEQLRRTAHACKNSAGVMRLEQLRAVATATEIAQADCIAEEAQKLRLAMLEATRALEALTRGQSRAAHRAKHA